MEIALTSLDPLTTGFKVLPPGLEPSNVIRMGGRPILESSVGVDDDSEYNAFLY